MTQVVADLEAIQEFRQALLNFAGRMYEILRRAEGEIARAESRLARAEAGARAQVRALTDELYYCRSVAAQGHPVDCSPLYYALQEAEDRLGRILAAKRRFQDALRWYDSAGNSLEKTLTRELSQGVTFLDRRITALRAYHATQLLETVTAIAASGVWQVMGLVPALLRQAQVGLNKALGDTGEEIAAVILSRRYGLQELPFTQPAHGIDRVFSAPGLPVIVVESKVSSSGKLRLGQTAKGEQGSPGWTGDKAVRMTDPASAQWSFANEEIGRLIQEIGPEHVPSITIVTDPTRRVADVYGRTAAGGWMLLEGGIQVSEYEES